MGIPKIFEPNWRTNWWRYWSNRLAIAWGAGGSALFEAMLNQIIVSQVPILDKVAELDQPWRSLLTFFVLGIVPIIVRSLHQPKLYSDAGDEEDK